MAEQARGTLKVKTGFAEMMRGGIAMPAGAALMMQLGCDGAFVGGGIEGVRPDQEPLAPMDMHIRRNAYGRQIDSFETTVLWSGIEGDPVKGVFLLVPRLADLGEDVEVLGASEDGEPLAVHACRALAAAFHPELTDDPRVHAFFLERVVGLC